MSLLRLSCPIQSTDYFVASFLLNTIKDKDSTRIVPENFKFGSKVGWVPKKPWFLSFFNIFEISITDSEFLSLSAGHKSFVISSIFYVLSDPLINFTPIFCLKFQIWVESGLGPQKSKIFAIFQFFWNFYHPFGIFIFECWS